MFRLLVETPAPKEQFEYILEEKNANSPSSLYIKVPEKLDTQIDILREIRDQGAVSRQTAIAG